MLIRIEIYLCELCQSFISIMRQIIGSNASIHLSMISGGISIHSLTVDFFKELRLVILGRRHRFCSRSFHIPEFTRFKSGLFSGH